MSVTTVEESVVSLSERAAQEIQQLMQQEGMTDAYLRIFVQGGGCSGLQYGMALANAADEGDLTVESGGVKLLIDDLSVQYVRGASIEFVEDDMGGGFKIDNPNAVRGCGCGSSFSTEDGPDGQSGGGCGGCCGSG